MTSPSFKSRLNAIVQQIAATQRLRPQRTVIAVSPTESLVDGRHCVSFATNDYLGLSRHPAVVERFAGVGSAVVGATASALIAGHSEWHELLERKLAEFKRAESAILFPSGFAANFGTLTALIGKRDAVFCDRDNHASLIDGCRASAGRFLIYDRCDLPALADAIRRRRADYDRIWVVTDSVFSMDGQLADLPALCDIGDETDSLVIVDEAHATGVFGEHGRGVAELQGVEDRVAVSIGTLSKALGGLGGFVTGPEALTSVLWNTARTQFFSTALPPALCAAAVTAIDVIEHEPERRRRLHANAILCRRLLNDAKLPVIEVPGAPESPIIAIVLGDESRAMVVSQALLEAGWFIPAIRPPTVPAGTSRLRMSISCEHAQEQIHKAIEMISQLLLKKP
jgi:8-amino-7-oxononanoate synthase